MNDKQSLASKVAWSIEQHMMDSLMLLVMAAQISQVSGCDLFDLERQTFMGDDNVIA